MRLEVDLVSVGEIPCDSSCLFHAIAVSISIGNMEWEEYLHGIEDTEWGDHICIMAASNLYNVAIGIVSSPHRGMQVLRPNDDDASVDSLRRMYIGHEFELHYIRLEPLTVTQQNAWIAWSGPTWQL
jgi:hypothetical protein